MVERSLIDLMRDQRPDAVALRHGSTCLTYGELMARAGSLAARLVRDGVGPGSLVAVCLDRGPDTVAALLGVAMSGAAYLPVDPGYPPARVAFVLADSGAVLALTEPHLAPSGIPALHVSAFFAAAARESDPPAVDLPAIDPESPAYVLYTSGSTGRPKGVVIPHRALLNFLRWARTLVDAGPGHVWLALTSLSFDISALELFLPLTTGGT